MIGAKPTSDSSKRAYIAGRSSKSCWRRLIQYSTDAHALLVRFWQRLATLFTHPFWRICMAMSTLEVGKKLVELCSQSKFVEAIDSLYAPNVVSIEAAAMPG